MRFGDLAMPRLRYGLDGPFVTVLALLAGWGLVMLASASTAIGEHMAGSSLYYLDRQLVFLALGMLAGALVFMVPMALWRRLGFPLLALALLLLAVVLIPGIGSRVNSASRWIHLGPLNVQASEPARLALVSAAGAAAAWLGVLPLRLIGLDTGEIASLPATLVAGASVAAVVYHWLELRLRATLPLATEAGLIELQSRVQPHFLFNTLNTAITLVAVDPDRAEQVLEDLAELFRAALGALEGESTLGEEIRLARLYLAIEGMRFGRRLEVEWDVDPAVDPARVPPLLLQPLVENAVRHGVEPNDAGGKLQIRARVRRGRAWVQVTNTVGAPGPAGHGIGLPSARERLRLMHDFQSEFEAGPTGDGRYRVRLAVPLGKP